MPELTVFVAQDTDHEFGRAYAARELGIVHLIHREAEKALPLLQRSFDLCTRVGTLLLYPRTAAGLGSR